jgi:hypothetical protein
MKLQQPGFELLVCLHKVTATRLRVTYLSPQSYSNQASSYLSVSTELQQPGFELLACLHKLQQPGFELLACLHKVTATRLRVTCLFPQSYSDQASSYFACLQKVTATRLRVTLSVSTKLQQPGFELLCLSPQSYSNRASSYFACLHKVTATRLRVTLPVSTKLQQPGFELLCLSPQSYSNQASSYYQASSYFACFYKVTATRLRVTLPVSTKLHAHVSIPGRLRRWRIALRWIVGRMGGAWRLKFNLGFIQVGPYKTQSSNKHVLRYKNETRSRSTLV